MGLDADSGPNLLLDWHESTDSRRWLRAGIGSVAVHIFLILIAFWVAGLAPPQVRTVPEIISNIQRVTLILPTDLTQKAPNKSKVSKEVNVEDLKPRRATEQRLPPAPARRVFRPPPQTAVTPRPGSPTEPPKLEAAAAPPQSLPPAGAPKAPPPPEIQPEEKPKLTFETPGQHVPNPQQSLSKLQMPKTTVEDAIHSVVRGGRQGNLSVGDMEQPPDLPETVRAPQLPGRSGSSLELLSDPMGVDFKPYLIQILARVRQNWFAVIPESARMGNRGVVLLQLWNVHQAVRQPAGVFVYHCFDRIVIHGYLSGCRGPSRWCTSSVRWSALPVVSKDILSQRTADYQNWVEAFARNHKSRSSGPRRACARKTMLPHLRRMAKKNAYGVYFIFKSMEQGADLPRQRAQISPPRTRTTASWRTSAAASRTTTSTSATKCSARWSCGWPPSFPSRPPTISTATASSSRS